MLRKQCRCFMKALDPLKTLPGVMILNSERQSEMSKPRTHKSQHFVAQCYTKAWYDPQMPSGAKLEPYVWVFDRDGNNARRKAPRNLFTETDIYTIERPDGERDLRFEHGFQELEDRFTRIRNLKFNRREWPDAEQAVSLFAFVATAQARTVAHRDFHRQQWGDIRKRMEEMLADFESASPKRKEAMAQLGRMNSGTQAGRGMTLDDVRDLEQTSDPTHHFPDRPSRGADVHAHAYGRPLHGRCNGVRHERPPLHLV